MGEISYGLKNEFEPTVFKSLMCYRIYTIYKQDELPVWPRCCRESGLPNPTPDAILSLDFLGQKPAIYYKQTEPFIVHVSDSSLTRISFKIIYVYSVESRKKETTTKTLVIGSVTL